MLDAWPLGEHDRSRSPAASSSTTIDGCGPSPSWAPAISSAPSRAAVGAPASRPQPRGRSRSAPAAWRRPSVDPWQARLYPARGFVPAKVSAPITVLRTKKQPYWRIRDDELGWSDRTTGGVDVHVVPGEHANLLREPHVADIARVLDACLRRADPPAPRPFPSLHARPWPIRPIPAL